MLRLVYLAYQVYCFFFRPLTLGVRVMMIQDGKVLLVRHTYLDGWFMPGGGVKRGETLDQAARREAHEEVGALLNEISLMGAYSHFLEWKSDHNERLANAVRSGTVLLFPGGEPPAYQGTD